MKTFKEFINESIVDQMTPKSDEEVRSKLLVGKPRDIYYRSIRYGYLDGVKIGLSKFTNNFLFKILNSGLDVAVNYNQTDIAKFLIELGANANNDEYYNMLYDSVILRNYNLVKLLIDNGCDPSDEDWEESLYIAAHNNDIEIVKLLLDKGKGKDMIGNNLIDDIEYKGFYDVYDLLIDFKKSELNESIIDQMTAKPEKDVNSLLGKMDPPDSLSKSISLDYLDGVKMTIKRIKKLIDSDNKPKRLKKRLESGTYLEYLLNGSVTQAATIGNLEIIKYLVEEENAKIPDDALIESSEYGHLDVVKYLIEHDVDIHYENNSALHLASVYGFLDIVQYLIDNGAILQNSATLEMTLRFGHREVYDLLKKHFDS